MPSFLKDKLKVKKFRSIENEALMSLIFSANIIKNKLEFITHQYGITSPQYNVLRTLKSVYPKGYPRYEIIERSVDKSPDITRLLDRLITMKLVERVVPAEDKRESVAKITKKGIKLLKEMDHDTKSFDDLFKNIMTKKESKILIKICDKIMINEMRKD